MRLTLSMKVFHLLGTANSVQAQHDDILNARNVRAPSRALNANEIVPMVWPGVSKACTAALAADHNLAVGEHEVAFDHRPGVRTPSRLRCRLGGFAPAFSRHREARARLEQLLQSGSTASMITVTMRYHDELDVLRVLVEAANVVSSNWTWCRGRRKSR